MPTVQNLPFPLGGRLVGVAGDLLGDSGEHVDFAIGGIPFLSAADQENPFVISTVPLRKEQFDQERDPGEQTLGSWWRRAQQTFAGGAGFTYQEDREGSEGTGFRDSYNIDVFGTPGEIKLYREMMLVGGSGYSRFKASADAYTWVQNGDLKWGQTEGTATFTYTPASGDVLDGGLIGPWGTGGAGATWWALLSTGNLVWGVGNTTTPTQTIPLGSGVATRAGYAKGRLWAFGGRDLWALNIVNSASAQNPIFTNPNPAWTYTDAAAGPTGVYFAGNDGWVSEIQLVSLDSSGGLPTLTGAAVTAAMPRGEIVERIEVLANTYMAIGGKTGLRIGILDSDGSITYGPRFISIGGGGRCSMITSTGHYFIVSFATLGNLGDNWIIDTSQPAEDGSFPYAKYVTLNDVALESAFMDNKTAPNRFKAVTVTGEMRLQSTTQYVASGWIRTGNIRFRTLEDKTFRSVSVTGPSLKGSIKTEVAPSTGGITQVGNASVQDSPVNESYAISLAPVQYVALTFTLTPPAGLLSTPIMNAWQLKAIPAASPQREFTIPLMCNDFEFSKQGLKYGYEGYANDRYQTLVQVEQTGQLIQFQDMVAPVNAPVECSIEGIQYVRTAPHTRTSDGGTLTLKLRTVN